MKDTVAILDYGMGNIHSLVKALKLYIPKVSYTKKLEEISTAKALILPGDGAFNAAMDGLAQAAKTDQQNTTSLKQCLLNFINSAKPVLGICIGFQILFEDSEESFGKENELRRGLGIIPGHIKKFDFKDKNIRVPHMGWNQVQTHKRLKGLYNPIYKAIRQKEYMYFIHSYRAVAVPENQIIAYCQYSDELFPAIVQKENIIATQFHPEKSGAAGLNFLRTWADSFALSSA